MPCSNSHFSPLKRQVNERERKKQNKYLESDLLAYFGEWFFFSVNIQVRTHMPSASLEENEKEGDDNNNNNNDDDNDAHNAINAQHATPEVTVNAMCVVVVKR